MLGNCLRYYKCDSFIHSMNPLCKILMFLIFIIMALFSSSVKSVVALFIIMCFITGLSNISYRNLFKPIWSIKYFVLTLFLIGLLFGFYSSFVFCFKICIVVFYYSVLIMSTKISDFVNGFYSLFKPLRIFGVLVDSCAINCSLFLCFIPFFVDNYSLYKSQSGSGVKGRICFLVNLLFVTYKNILKKRDIMIIRGYCSCDSSYSLCLSDVYTVVCYLLVLVMVLVKEVVV